MNLVFAWAEDGKEMKVDVPLVFKGEDACPGIQKGWYLAFRFLMFHFFLPVLRTELDICCLSWQEKLLKINESGFVCISATTDWS